MRRRLPEANTWRDSHEDRTSSLDRGSCGDWRRRCTGSFARARSFVRHGRHRIGADAGGGSPGHRAVPGREVALAEGYIRDPNNMCETAEMMGRPAALGAMGIHYFRPDLLGITAPPSPRVNGNGTHTDFRKPSILIYEPQADGSLELVAVENLVFARAWRAAGHTEPPSFQGVPYDSMADDPTTPVDEAHMFEPHFDRHVWIYRENPNGVFTPLNPAVSCANHRGTNAHVHGSH